MPGTGKVCVVTGGAGAAIGAGITTALAGRGHDVWIADIDVGRADQVAKELNATGGGQVRTCAMDTSDPDSVREAVDHIRAVTPLVHGLVNSAGIGVRKPSADFEVADFDRLVAINLRGPWLCTKLFMPALLEAGGGSIVNIGSVHARLSNATSSLYAATKAGLVGLTRGVAADYGDRAIRCNIIHPGSVLTAAEVAEQPTPGDGTRWIDRLTRSHQSLLHYIDPVEIGHTAAFLLSDEARSITGQEIVVDAGLTSLLFCKEGLAHEG